MNEPTSPELVLVSPELRERAIAELPPIMVDSFIRPSRNPVGGLRDLVEIALAATATVVGVVLALTLIADALR